MIRSFKMKNILTTNFIRIQTNHNHFEYLIYFVRANPFDRSDHASMRLSRHREYDVAHIKFSLTIEQGISVDRLYRYANHVSTPQMASVLHVLTI